MSRHNRDRRKYRCPCGNPFSAALVDETEKAAAESRAKGLHLPKQIPHACGRCHKRSVLEDGRFRYMTPAEEFEFRMEFPQAAAFQDFAIAADLPDCAYMTPATKKENP